MRDLSKTDDSTLIDLLADYTNRYNKSLPGEPGHKECKEFLDAIIIEIKTRRKKDHVKKNDQLLSNTNTDSL